MEQWRDFVEHHPAGNIFHTPEMFEVFARTRLTRPELWAALDGDRVLALAVPVRISLYRPPLSLFTTRSVVYGGLLSSPDRDGVRALSYLLSDYCRHTKLPLFTELRHLSDASGFDTALQRQGFCHEDHLNYLIALDRPADAIFQGIGPRTRKNIRRALNRGTVVMREITSAGELSACQQLLEKTYRAARVPLADRSLFEAAFDVLYPKRMIRFTLACVDDRPAAVSVELLYKNVMYGWYGGTDRQFGQHIPNDLLTWHLLSWGAEQGFCVYDFGGAGKPDESYGVRDFKSKFGGSLVNYGRSVCVHSPVLTSVASKLYERARGVLYGQPLLRERLQRTLHAGG